MYCGSHSRGEAKSRPTFGNITMAAPCTWEMKLRVSAAGQTGFASPCSSTHGLARFLIGKKSTPCPRALRTDSSPEPLHKGFSRLIWGQKPKVNAAAKVFRGACASAAYAMAAPDETPANIGGRYVAVWK